ncbi:protein suppressor of variegation 3-7 [Stomoxys calcitrans]|uniref:BESS domain-containing protein n=1 Tax=Stomoxys calcitrans TaxID=35570 RepID=A0A1I8Q0S3_STOCA|nr:protein suppressor of variegation 3-7 [Stomoxys calcitrans]
MNYADDPNDPDWKVSKVKSETTVKDHPNNSNNKPKYSQKFCEKWLKIFYPWLARCEDDPNKPFCRACVCRLDCNRCHLQRHERTTKHARNLEILISKGEGGARQNLSIRRERSKYYKQRKRDPTVVAQDECMDEFIDEPDPEIEFTYEQQTDEPTSEDQFTQEDNTMDNTDMMPADIVQQIITTRPITKNNTARPRKVVKNEETSEEIEDATERKEGMKLLLQIQKDKSDLMDSFKELMGGSLPLSSPPREKNHVDLFFESVSSSVKALSPKLIAEAKMRVSQLICELELRALTENDVHQQSTVVLANEEETFVINQNMQHVETHYEALS